LVGSVVTGLAVEEGLEEVAALDEEEELEVFFAE
jgi:hypothetical protein